ncbi:MAG: Holliday junction branch migration protein RuvA [Clostridia bacterium]|nr:Holliday junction branch migration protein RuvA [Clostridia bacterium]
MYSYIIGVITHKEDGRITLENNGIGYEINVSNQTLSSFSFENEPVKLYTYLNVREDEMSLFGFATTEEKNLFLKLITVSGIGPRMAIGILSEVSISGFMSAIASEDVKTLAKIKGIGKKTAERIILELKDKINPLEAMSVGGEISVQVDDSVFDDAVATLVNLGINKNNAYMLVKQVAKQEDTLEDIITKALREMGR